MCESNVYIIKNGKEELILEDVDIMEKEGNQIRMKSIFGEEKVIKAKLKKLSLVEHKILLEPIQ